MKKFTCKEENFLTKLKIFKMTRRSHSFCMSKFIFGFLLSMFVLTYVYDGTIIAFDNPMSYITNLSNKKDNSDNLNPKAIDGHFSYYFNVSNIENYTYTSKDIKPYVNVYYNNPNYIDELYYSDYEDYLTERKIDFDKGVLLKRNVDYKIEYLGDKNGSLKNAGTHYIKITGIGEFSGEKIISFSVLPCEIDLNKLRCHDENNIDYYYISRDDYNLVSKERDGSASCINDANDMILYFKNNSDYIKFVYDDAKFTKISQAHNNERVDAYIANCDINNYNSLLDVSFKNVRLSSENNSLILNNYIIKEDKNITDGYNAIVSKIGIIKDTSLPTLVKITSSDNTFKYGEVIKFKLVSDEEVKLNSGTISLKIKANPGDGSDIVNNSIVSQPIKISLKAESDKTYSKEKTFTYRVQRNDMALSKMQIVSIDLSKGSLTDLYQHELKIDQSVIDDYNKNNETYIDTKGYNVTISAYDNNDKSIKDNSSNLSMIINYNITLSETPDRELTKEDIYVNYGDIVLFEKIDMNKYHVQVNIAKLLEQEIKNESNINSKNYKELIFKVKSHVLGSTQSKNKNSGKTFTIKIKEESIYESKNELVDEINEYIENDNKLDVKKLFNNGELLRSCLVRVGMILNGEVDLIDFRTICLYFAHLLFI